MNGSYPVLYLLIVLWIVRYYGVECVPAISEIRNENSDYVFGLTINDVQLLASELTDRTKTKYLFNKATAFPGKSRLHVFREFHPKLCRLVKQPVLPQLSSSTHQMCSALIVEECHK
jgi:hypothetical protein